MRKFCILTNRKRGLLNRFKLSRIQFKQFATTGDFIGIRKASW